jgi:hypothetical protein
MKSFANRKAKMKIEQTYVEREMARRAEADNQQKEAQV